MDSFIYDERVAREASVKMSGERHLILACFEEQVGDLQALVKANVAQILTLREAMTTVTELLESGRSINKSDYSVKIPKSHAR